MRRAARIACLAEKLAPLTEREERRRLQAGAGAAYRAYLEEQGRRSWGDPAADEHWVEWCEANGEADLVEAFYQMIEERVAEIEEAQAAALRRSLANFRLAGRRQGVSEAFDCSDLLPRT